MLTGVSSCAVMTATSLGRYTHLLMDASPEFPVHFLKIYSRSGAQNFSKSPKKPILMERRVPHMHQANPGERYNAESSGVLLIMRISCTM
jgi:hypothetical protein